MVEDKNEFRRSLLSEVQIRGNPKIAPQWFLAEAHFAFARPLSVGVQNLPQAVSPQEARNQDETAFAILRAARDDFGRSLRRGSHPA
jgi:hypothetical protein